MCLSTTASFLPLLFAVVVFIVIPSSVNAVRAQGRTRPPRVYQSPLAIAAKLNRHFFSYFSNGRGSSSFSNGRESSSFSKGRNNYKSNIKNTDLLFIMDNSGSIGSSNFVKQKRFVSLMIDHAFTVTCTPSIRTAVISFAASSQIRVEFDFNKYSNSETPRADLKNAVNGISYIHGYATNTAGALDEAHSLLNDASRGARANATRLVFVLTDGRSNQGEDPGTKADILRQIDAAVIFAMGAANMESTGSRNELNAIASDPDDDHVYKVADFNDMDNITDNFGDNPRCDMIDLATHRPEDWKSIVAGFTALKRNGVINDLAAIHEEAFKSSHNDASFFPWHRAFLSMMEHALQIARNDVSLRLPYWNWAGEELPTSAIWAHLGGSINNGENSNNCVHKGPFSQELWHDDPSECIKRNIFSFPPDSDIPFEQASEAELNSDRTANTTYHKFRIQTEAGERRHNAMHNRFGPDSDMFSYQSPRDPLFYFHHCFVDKLWYDWQKRHGNGLSNYPATGHNMSYLSVAYPNNSGVQLLKHQAWYQPENLLKVANLGYTYDENLKSPFGRNKRYTVKPRRAVSETPGSEREPDLLELSVSNVRAAISSRRPTQLQVVQWDFESQCWFESDRLTPSQQDLCIRRGIVPGIRLVGGPNRFEGRVEILVSGRYHAVCGDGWDNVDANVLCGQLGYSTGWAFSGYMWGYARKHHAVTQIGCTGSERYIQDCSRNHVKSPQSDDSYCLGYAEVKCNPGVRFITFGRCISSDCSITSKRSVTRDRSMKRKPPISGYRSITSDRTKTSDRLIKSRPRPPITDDHFITSNSSFPRSSGYLQVYNSLTKRWGSVCGGVGWGNRERTDACEQAGFGPAYPLSIRDRRLREETATDPKTSPLCLSSTNKNMDCNQGIQWGASICPRSTDNLYISCQQPIRLADGHGHQGRVEVFNRGVWGTVCDTIWDSQDAEVVCRQLGYSNGGTALALRGAFYGQGSGPVWLDTVSCRGDERSLTDCKHSGFGRTSCLHSSDAAVRCDT